MCPLLIDYVEKVGERILLAITDRAGPDWRSDDSMHAAIESLLRDNSSELIVGDFFNTIDPSQRFLPDRDSRSGVGAGRCPPRLGLFCNRQKSYILSDLSDVSNNVSVGNAPPSVRRVADPAMFSKIQNTCRGSCAVCRVIG